MANEITASLLLKAAKGTAPQNISPTLSTSFQADMTGSKYVQNRQAVGTSAEAMLKGDIGTIGYVLLHNMDATNYVSISSDSGGADPIGKLNPGKSWLVYVGAANLYLLANTAACDV